MNLLEYLDLLIPLDSMTPEVQTMIAAVLAVLIVRLFLGSFTSIYEGIFK